MSVAKRVVDSSEAWPALPFSEWADTYATLHMVAADRDAACKAVGASSARESLVGVFLCMVSARGLTTSPISLLRTACLKFNLDFIDHRLDASPLPRAKRKACAWSHAQWRNSIPEFFALLRTLDIVKVKHLEYAGGNSLGAIRDPLCRRPRSTALMTCAARTPSGGLW